MAYCIVGHGSVALLLFLSLQTSPDRPARPAQTRITKATPISEFSTAAFFAAKAKFQVTFGSDTTQPITGNTEPFSVDPLNPLRDLVSKTKKTEEANAISVGAGFTSFDDWVGFGNRLANAVAFISLRNNRRDLNEQIKSATDVDTKQNLQAILSRMDEELKKIPAPPASGSEVDFIENNLPRIEGAFAGRPF